MWLVAARERRTHSSGSTTHDADLCTASESAEFSIAAVSRTELSPTRYFNAHRHCSQTQSSKRTSNAVRQYIGVYTFGDTQHGVTTEQKQALRSALVRCIIPGAEHAGANSIRESHTGRDSLDGARVPFRRTLTAFSCTTVRQSHGYGLQKRRRVAKCVPVEHDCHGAKLCGLFRNGRPLEVAGQAPRPVALGLAGAIHAAGVVQAQDVLHHDHACGRH